jgi:hypothetical protein
MAVNVKISIAGMNSKQASAVALTAPFLESKRGIQLGGSSILTNGQWKIKNSENISVKNNMLKVYIPAGTAYGLSVN